MANPYLFETVNPMDIAMRGFQGIASIRNMQQQSQLIRAQQEEATARAAAVQAEAARAKEVNDYFAGLAAKAEAGTITANDYAAAALRHREIFEPAMQAAGGLKMTGDRQRFQETFTPFALLSMGKTEEAKKFFADRREAFANAGDTQRAGLMDGFIRMVEQNPLALQLDLGVTAAAADQEAFKSAQEMLPPPPSKEPENVRSARAYAMTFGPEGSPEYTSAFREALVRPPAPAAVVNVGGPGGLQLTPGQEAVDKKFADTYLAWIDGGGAATASRIATLNSAITKLSSGQPLTGPVVGITPDFLEAWINPQATVVRQDVQSAVVEGLRQALGAQFTEKEGTRLLNLAFDPSLPPAENKRRVQRLVAATQSALDAKSNAVAYFEEKGTMQGYRYRAPSVGDFEAAIRGEGPLVTRPTAARNFTAMSNDALLRLDPQRLSQDELRAYNDELTRRGFD